MDWVTFCCQSRTPGLCFAAKTGPPDQSTFSNMGPPFTAKCGPPRLILAAKIGPRGHTFCWVHI